MLKVVVRFLEAVIGIFGLMVFVSLPVHSASADSDNIPAGARDQQQLCAQGSLYLQQRQAVCETLSDGSLIYRLPLQFGSGSAVPAGDSFSALYHLARYLNQYPHMQVTIVGHSDNRGSWQGNQWLSLQRAKKTRHQLLVEFGINGARIHTKGESSNEPVADNGSSWGRMQNRRVEILIAPINSAS